MSSQPNPQSSPSATTKTIEEILANAKAKTVETMNATTVAPNSKEIELTHTGEFKDGDIVNVRINNFVGHPLYTATVKGYKLLVDREIPYKIDVGTQISLLTWPETIAAINNYTTQAVIKELETHISDLSYAVGYTDDQPFLKRQLELCKERLDKLKRH